MANWTLTFTYCAQCRSVVTYYHIVSRLLTELSSNPLGLFQFRCLKTIIVPIELNALARCSVCIRYYAGNF